MVEPGPHADGSNPGAVEETTLLDRTGFAPPSPDVSLDADIEVRVLGPVEIAGAAAAIERAKAMELVVHLALHRGAAIGADRLMEALWPGRAPSGGNLNMHMSLARKALGRAKDGSPYLPLVRGGRIYRLGPSVSLDYDVFVRRVTHAREQIALDAMPILRSALELVRGRPLEVAGKGYEWAHVEGIISHIEAAVADAAYCLAQLYYGVGDAEGMRWAAERGLRASPGNEQLYRDLMYAADLEGNRAGVEAVMTELTRLVEDEEPYGLIHPQTVAAYKELTSVDTGPRSWGAVQDLGHSAPQPERDD